MTKIKHTINTSARMVVAISKKICGCYAHSCQDNYRMRPKVPFYTKHEGVNPKCPKHNYRRSIVIKFMVRRWLVEQSTSRGHKFCIRSLIWVHDSMLERHIQDLHLPTGSKLIYLVAIYPSESPKKLF